MLLLFPDEICSSAVDALDPGREGKGSPLTQQRFPAGKLRRVRSLDVLGTDIATPSSTHLVWCSHLALCVSGVVVCAVVGFIVCGLLHGDAVVLIVLYIGLVFSNVHACSRRAATPWQGPSSEVEQMAFDSD